MDENRIRRLMDAFETPTSSITRDRLLEACEGSESILRKLEDMQVVLPEDFWSPESYTLDPIFQTFHLGYRWDGPIAHTLTHMTNAEKHPH